MCLFLKTASRIEAFRHKTDAWSAFCNDAPSAEGGAIQKDAGVGTCLACKV